MERSDFRVIADHRGYQIQYKSQNIGGAGILPSAKGPRTMKAKIAQAQDYIASGESSIRAILKGRGERRFIDMIERIDKEDSCQSK